jgi:hypothetical protein
MSEAPVENVLSPAAPQDVVACIAEEVLLTRPTASTFDRVVSVAAMKGATGVVVRKGH